MADILITHPGKKELDALDISKWSPWECEPSTFDWQYDDEEWAYVFEGRVRVKTDRQDVDIKKGDLVKFPKGLRCRWTVIEKIRKVYIFK
jgi:uncharacterized protein